MRKVLLNITLALSHLLRAQPQQSPEFHIGFTATTLFNDSLPYSAFGYSGPAPLFVQIWHPLSAAPTTSALTYRELRDRGVGQDLRRVYDELLLRADSAFIEYDLRYAVDGETPLNYAPFTEQQVLDSLLALHSDGHLAALSTTHERPVILYHHGSQGMSDENVRMAEYFAAHGYIFISCNFHWPLTDAPYGTPLVWEPDRSSVRQLLRYARYLAKGKPVFYIGHSWGAQEGWCTLYEPGSADGFVSLETTLEAKTDTAEVRDKWPHVLDALQHERYQLPILLVADAGIRSPYHFFKDVSASMSYIAPERPLAHEGYTSAWFLRSQAPQGMPVPDADALQQQYVTYAALLPKMLEFLRSVEHGEHMPGAPLR